MGSEFIRNCIFYSPIDDTLEVDTQVGQDNTNGLTSNEIASIRLPQSIISIVETDRIDLAFTLYNKSVFFPIRDPPPNTIVGSSVISARIAGVADGTQLPDPVVINLALKRTAVSEVSLIMYTSHFQRISLTLAVCIGISLQQVNLQ